MVDHREAVGCHGVFCLLGAAKLALDGEVPRVAAWAERTTAVPNGLRRHIPTWRFQPREGSPVGDFARRAEAV
jgi:hypothetical protein